MRKALKCKQLEDDNKKLRKLLKTQIENSEQLRQDTHNTIETLREEFDILVRELLQYKQNDAQNKGANPGSGPSQAGRSAAGPAAGGTAVPNLGALPTAGQSTQGSNAPGGQGTTLPRGLKRQYNVGAGK